MAPTIEPGCLLIASPVLRDPNFRRTVVLLCEHGEEGSMGLVINRPTEYSLAEALSGMPERAQQALFWGGPVQPQMVLVLHRNLYDAPGAKEICSGMALGGDGESLMHLLENAPQPEQRVRVFVGYAGWGAGQLADEMADSSWLVCPASGGIVFGADPEETWSEALRTLGPRYAYLATMPTDPRVN